MLKEKGIKIMHALNATKLKEQSKTILMQRRPKGRPVEERELK